MWNLQMLGLPFALRAYIAHMDCSKAHFPTHLCPPQLDHPVKSCASAPSVDPNDPVVGQNLELGDSTSPFKGEYSTHSMGRPYSYTVYLYILVLSCTVLIF